MKYIRKKPLSGCLVIIIILIFITFFSAQWTVKAQQSTPVLPTVTGTAVATWAEVKPVADNKINVRAGPNTTFPKVGVLMVGQRVPALGITKGGKWIQIAYPGVQGGTAWVNAPLVNIIGQELPIVEEPQEPTPLYTSTIDPTLAARFVITSVPTRLPTFTAPPPLVIPTMPVNNSSQTIGKVPMALVIIILASAGLIIGLFTLVQGR